jgi:hypothetical protein
MTIGGEVEGGEEDEDDEEEEPTLATCGTNCQHTAFVLNHNLQNRKFVI